MLVISRYCTNQSHGYLSRSDVLRDYTVDEGWSITTKTVDSESVRIPQVASIPRRR